MTQHLVDGLTEDAIVRTSEETTLHCLCRRMFTVADAATVEEPQHSLADRHAARTLAWRRPRVGGWAICLGLGGTPSLRALERIGSERR